MIYKQSENLKHQNNKLDFSLIKKSEKLDYLKDFLISKNSKIYVNFKFPSYENIFEILNYLENLEGGLFKENQNLLQNSERRCFRTQHARYQKLRNLLYSNGFFKTTVCIRLSTELKLQWEEDY